MTEKTAVKTTPVSQFILNSLTESEIARRGRMDLNQKNFDCYNLKQDYSHKKAGQSREFLPKQSTAVEQTTSFVQQALIDTGRWFEVLNMPGTTEKIITAEDMEKLLKYQVDRNDPPAFISDMVKLGALGSLMISKVHGENVFRNEYFVEKDELTGNSKLMKKQMKKWQLKWSHVRQEDYYPDPTGDGLYEIERIRMDKYKLIQLAEANPDIYDLEAVKGINTGIDAEQENKQARETNQMVSDGNSRNRIEIFEFYGDILEPTTGKLLHEKSVCAITKDGTIIRQPKKYGFWHGKSPFVVAPIIRVPNSVWHKAMMDSPTAINGAMNELYNLILDAGLMSVFGIKELKEHLLDDPDQVNEGIGPGDVLSINTQARVGEQALTRVDTGGLSNEALQAFQMTDREFLAAALTNDVRSGTLPARQTKATEIIASNQAITGIFNGLVKVIENVKIRKLLELSWLTIAQHVNDLDAQDIKEILGEEKAAQISAMSNEEIFAETANGRKFKVFGLSAVLNKLKDFQKITTLLQTVASSPHLMQLFLEKYSGTKLLGEIIKSLDIDDEKIAADEQEMEKNKQMSDRISQAEAPGDGSAQVERAENQTEESGTGLEPNRKEISTMLQGQ